MEVIIQNDPASAAVLTARVIATQLRANPSLVLGLATGRTMLPVYDELARMHEEEALDFARCVTFNLDEYIGLTPDNPFSYRYYMNRNLFDRVNIAPRNTHVLNGMANDLDAECVEYERTITACGGIGLQLLGIGNDGHIGFNEPLSALRSRTRQKALTPATVAQNAPLFDNPDQMPRRALTMGVGTILESGRCIVLVTGEEKAEILARAVEGPITSMVTASALQLHPRCTYVVDEAAAMALDHKDYYRWIFDHEPEWQGYRACGDARPRA